MMTNRNILIYSLTERYRGKMEGTVKFKSDFVVNSIAILGRFFGCFHNAACSAMVSLPFIQFESELFHRNRFAVMYNRK